MAKRSRDSGVSESPDAQKRLRTSSDNEAAACQYARLQDARFPAQIEALPHVLKLLDIMLMTPGEAVVEAAVTGQRQWLRFLLNKVKCKLAQAQALTAAAGAARDQKAAVKLLLKALNRPGQKLQAEGLQAVLKALPRGQYTVPQINSTVEVFQVLPTVLAKRKKQFATTFTPILKRRPVHGGIAATGGHSFTDNDGTPPGLSSVAAERRRTLYALRERRRRLEQGALGRPASHQALIRTESSRPSVTIDARPSCARTASM